MKKHEKTELGKFQQGTESFMDLLQQTRSLKDECKISDHIKQKLKEVA